MESGVRYADRVVSGFAGERRNKNFLRKFLNYYYVSAGLEATGSGVIREECKRKSLFAGLFFTYD